MPKRNSKQSNVSDYFNGKIFFNFSTKDFSKSIPFYHEGLGLEPTDFSKDGPGAEKQGLYEFDLPAKGAILTLAKSQNEKIVENDSLVIMVNQIDRCRELLLIKNIQVSQITDVPGLLSFLKIKDPDGNSITFMSEPRT